MSIFDKSTAELQQMIGKSADHLTDTNVSGYYDSAQADREKAGEIAQTYLDWFPHAYYTAPCSPSWWMVPVRLWFIVNNWYAMRDLTLLYMVLGCITAIPLVVATIGFNPYALECAVGVAGVGLLSYVGFMWREHSRHANTFAHLFFVAEKLTRFMWNILMVILAIMTLYLFYRMLRDFFNRIFG